MEANYFRYVEAKSPNFLDTAFQFVQVGPSFSGSYISVIVLYTEYNCTASACLFKILYPARKTTVQFVTESTQSKQLGKASCPQVW